MKTALVVIDVQNYFVNSKTKELPKKIANHIQKSNYDFVLFTQFINKKDSNFFKLLNWRKCTSSPEIDIHPTLIKFTNSKNTFKKSTYSIFGAKGFTRFLQKNKVSRIFLCGIDTDSCILASAYDAFDLGYHIKILEEFCLSHSGKDFHSAAIKIINKNIQK